MSHAAQLSLFDAPKRQPRARRTDRATSHAAAVAMRGVPAHGHYAAILAALVRPMTFWQIADAARMAGQQVNKRLGELEDRGLIRDTGRQAPSPSGRACTLWERINV